MKNNIPEQVKEHIDFLIKKNEHEEYISRLLRFSFAVYCFEKVNKKLLKASDVFITMIRDKEIIIKSEIGSEKMIELNTICDIHLDTL